MLRDSLNGYALGADERLRWEQACDAGEETASCRLFGPDKLLDHFAEFFGYFMVRKLMADAAFCTTPALWSPT